MIGVMLIMRRLGWVIRLYLGPIIGLANGPYVVGNGLHVVGTGPHVLSNEKVEDW